MWQRRKLTVIPGCPNALTECLEKTGLMSVLLYTTLFLVSGASESRFSESQGEHRDGDLILVGGEIGGHGGRGGKDSGIATKGNVLIYSNGQFWSVCDDNWNALSASVVCRCLGFPGAVGHTTQSYFGKPEQDIGIDDVICLGNETSILNCKHSALGVHNCDKREAAGVICSTATTTATTATTTATTATTTTSMVGISTTPFTTRKAKKPKRVLHIEPERQFLETNELFMEAMQLDDPNPRRHKPSAYDVRVVGGRRSSEGRVEVKIDGTWGAICSDRWTQLEARVACRQAGLGLARSAVKSDYFGGRHLVKLAAGIECDGDEEKLSDCYHEQSGQGTSCPSSTIIAGVMCSTKLPDLVPNATLLEKSTYLQDQPMYYMQCALEENCASSSAFQIKATNRDWHIFRRRLLRFSSSTWNFGTAPFLPSNRKDSWEWHMCHMHYHSMSTFAHYDILDQRGNKVAEGHKASFCLEDVRCMPGVTKKYACAGFGDQGISVGCADDYLHDIDCQWIDITDVKPGRYIFKVKVNPEYLVGELDYNNNAAICQLTFSGISVSVTNCVLGRG